MDAYLCFQHGRLDRVQRVHLHPGDEGDGLHPRQPLRRLQRSRRHRRGMFQFLKYGKVVQIKLDFNLFHSWVAEQPSTKGPQSVGPSPRNSSGTTTMLTLIFWFLLSFHLAFMIYWGQGSHIIRNLISSTQVPRVHLPGHALPTPDEARRRLLHCGQVSLAVFIQLFDILFQHHKFSSFSCCTDSMPQRQLHWGSGRARPLLPYYELANYKWG